MKRSFVIGTIAGIGLLSFYFIILSLANSFQHSMDQFFEMWYWVLILVFGFGLQVGLYDYIRNYGRNKAKAMVGEVIASGGISTTSMIACCAHHLADILPIIGLSAVAFFFVKYQIAFILLGIFSNFVGISMMLNIIQKHRLFNKKGLMAKILRYDMKKIRNAIIAISVIVVGLAFANSSLSLGENSKEFKKSELSLLPRESNEGGVSIILTPRSLDWNKEIEFDVAINTHHGSLDFDMTKVSFLLDDKGREYKPLKWKGSPPGGHHRYGKLIFPPLQDKTTYIKVIIKDVYGVKERVFLWRYE